MIDNMIVMLEKYANHLEELVAERTKELDAEKIKTENLLYRMLPQYVWLKSFNFITKILKYKAEHHIQSYVINLPKIYRNFHASKMIYF